MRFFALILLVHLTSLADASAQFKWRETPIEGRIYVPISDVAAFYGYRLLSSPGGFNLTMSVKHPPIIGRAGASDVKINGVKFVLCFPTVSHGGQVFISKMDVIFIIEPVLRSFNIKNPTVVKTVILDAGHGGHDHGATGNGLREKDMNLDVVYRAGRMLQARGFNVYVTRKDDTFIPLEKRTALANRTPNAVFISVHFNDSKNIEASGIETFVLAPRGVPSMGRDELGVIDDRVHPGHARNAENILLAASVHSAMVARSQIPDRGIKRARFHVLRNSRIPAILIEGGFMRNPRDGRLIADANYRQQLATAIVAGVERFRASVARPGQYVPSPAQSSIPQTTASAVSASPSVSTRPGDAQPAVQAHAEKQDDDKRAVDEAMQRLQNSQTPQKSKTQR